MFKVHLVLELLLLLGVSSQKDDDEGRPYEFSFTIDGEQHRYEKKDVNGIIQGEFGFITGDGVYHVTVYATDENGSFKILSMKNTKISEPLDRGGKPSTAGLVRQPTSAQQPTGGIPPKPAPAVGQPPPPVSKPSAPIAQPPPPAAVPTSAAIRPVQPSVTTSRTPYDFTTASTVRNGCSGCGIVTKAPPGPLNFQNPAFKKASKEGQSLPTPPAQVLSDNRQPVPPSGPAGNDIPSGLVSKPFLPAGQSSNYPNAPSDTSISIPNSPVNIGTGQPAPPQTILLAPGTNPAPTGSSVPTQQNPFGPSIGNQPTPINVLSQPQALSPRPSSSQPLPGEAQNQISGKPAPVNIPSQPQALAPRPPSSQPLPGPAQNQIPGKPALSQVTVSDGVINVPGNEPIAIKDKYPNMVDGLPEGISERDITDLLYKFNYTVGFHGHYEKGLRNGAKVGGYFVNGRDGISRVVTYVADENGYRPKFKLINLGFDSEDTPKPDSEKKFGLKNFEFIWYPVK